MAEDQDTTNPGAVESPDALKKRIAELEETNSVLVKKIADNGNRKRGDLPQTKVDGKLYQFTCPKFTLDGTPYNAGDAKNNASVCKQLVKMGSALLKPVATEE